ncbi:MAG: threonine synthase [Bacillota bacterium]|nr:threonine synthase [Bacillota bacterium]
MYNSTVDKKCSVSSAQAIAQGISDDGGLFVPSEIPAYSAADFEALKSLNYQGRAKKILGDFLTDFSKEEIDECVDLAYTAEKFEIENPTQIASRTFCGDKINILELWHGPTSAFKDMALQILPHLLTKSFKKTYDGKEAVILVATSGDTGKAALEGFKDVPGTKMIVFYPENGVSPMQKHQMNVQLGENLNVCAIKGNFDDAQTCVKNIFTNSEIKAKLEENNMIFSSANSINWGRLLPQIVYYISAYCDLMSKGVVKYPEKINIVVPTGNFGNILAAYYAYKMGIPVNKFICASNSNNVLTEFIETGIYNKNRMFFTTNSPSMDILVSSNLERLLYHLSQNDDTKIKGYMQSLKQSGSYEIDAEMKAELQKLFFGGYCDDKATKETIAKMFSEDNYLLDTHTAVAVNVYHQYIEKTNDSSTPVILASTASPYKFSKSVLEAISPDDAKIENEFKMIDRLNEITKVHVPKPLDEIKTMKPRFNNVTEIEKMPEYVLGHLGL